MGGNNMGIRKKSISLLLGLTVAGTALGDSVETFWRKLLLPRQPLQFHLKVKQWKEKNSY